MSAPWILPVCLGILAGFALATLLATRRASRKLHEWHRKRNAERRTRIAEEEALVHTIATGLAHEVRNPLSALRMNIQLLREEWADPITERERTGLRKIDVLLRETDRVQKVVDTFLKFAGGHRLAREPVDVNQLLDELTIFLSPQAEALKIRFDKRFAPDRLSVQADPGLLRQAFLNVLVNAQQAMSEGGTIAITTRDTDGGVRIELADDGPGIPPDVHGRIFDIYYSTKPSGTGLGLPISRKILREHGGAISVECPPEGGTRVILEIPHE